MDSEECEHDEKCRRKERHNLSNFNAHLRARDTKKRELSTPLATKEKTFSEMNDQCVMRVPITANEEQIRTIAKTALELNIPVEFF